MNRSEQINELAAALAKAQGEIKGAIKDSTNEFFKKDYADLAAVLEAVREPFAKNGLSICQLPGYEGATPILETILMHSSGQFLSSTSVVKMSKDDPQGYGSGLTYLRRYMVAAFAGVAQIDDDAESEQGRGPEIKNVKTVPAKQTEDHGGDSACAHDWKDSQYNHKQQYCAKCKVKRDKAS